MSLNLQQLKSIKGTTTMLVFGYVREIQCKYFEENHIPPLIYYTCLSYTPIEYRSYKDFNLKQDLITGILSCGFSKPTKIETLIIPHILQKHNIICQSETVTHKILSYAIPALQIIDPTQPHCQILVISSDWQGCLCFIKLFESLSKYLDVNIKAFRNKVDLEEDINNAQLVIGAISAVEYMVSQHILNFKSIKLFILHGIDDLLQNSPHLVSSCINTLSAHQQIVVFSGTMYDHVSEFFGDYIRNPIKIIHKSETEFTLNGVKQYYIDVEKEYEKLSVFQDLFQSMTITQAIIYCNTSQTVMWLSEKLEQCEF
eukprot:427297_1